MRNQALADIYRDYLNNFLTVECFAEYHDIDKKAATHLIDAGRAAHDARVFWSK